ncbi:MAG: hypothetical protein L0211_25520 [Planctomycetaceae bacterium]|nr:hypothetical protein [Planctomycetaceae bacterium]
MARRNRRAAWRRRSSSAGRERRRDGGFEREDREAMAHAPECEEVAEVSLARVVPVPE